VQDLDRRVKFLENPPLKTEPEATFIEIENNVNDDLQF